MLFASAFVLHFYIIFPHVIIQCSDGLWSEQPGLDPRLKEHISVRSVGRELWPWIVQYSSEKQLKATSFPTELAVICLNTLGVKKAEAWSSRGDVCTACVSATLLPRTAAVIIFFGAYIFFIRRVFLW
jgi:hypothetical protein